MTSWCDVILTCEVRLLSHGIMEQHWGVMMWCHRENVTSWCDVIATCDVKELRHCDVWCQIVESWNHWTAWWCLGVTWFATWCDIIIMIMPCDINVSIHSHNYETSWNATVWQFHGVSLCNAMVWYKASCDSTISYPVDIFGTVVGESLECLLLFGTVVGENPDHVSWVVLWCDIKLIRGVKIVPGLGGV